MKYFPLLWATLWRKKARTIFTLLSIVIAFLLFGMLQGVNAAFQQGVNNANVNRLIVASRISLTEPLPISQKQQIEAVPGITGVASQSKSEERRVGKECVRPCEYRWLPE